MGPCTPDLRFPGQTKQTSGYLLLLLAGSITEGKMKLGISQVINASCPVIKCVELKDGLAFVNVEVERIVYLLGFHVTSKET
jgi:hypothetical protein